MKSLIPIDDLHDPMGNKGCVSQQCGLAIYIQKYLKAK